MRFVAVVLLMYGCIVPMWVIACFAQVYINMNGTPPKRLGALWITVWLLSVAGLVLIYVDNLRFDSNGITWYKVLGLIAALLVIGSGKKLLKAARKQAQSTR